MREELGAPRESDSDSSREVKRKNKDLGQFGVRMMVLR